MWLALLLGTALGASDPPPEEAPEAPAEPEPVEDEEGSTPTEPPAPAAPEVYEIPRVPELDSVVEAAEVAQRTLLRSRVGVRPELGLVLATDQQVDAGARLGGTIAVHWWTVPQKGLRWSGETLAGAAGLVGGVQGWDAEVSSTVGPWLGPVSLRLGPVLRGDSTGSPNRTTNLPDAFLVGFKGTMTVDADHVVFQAGATPVWAVAGTRAAGPAPGVTELDVHGSLSFRARLGPLIKLQVGVGSTTRLTAIGPLVDLHLLLHLAPGIP
ncbi:MAG: hypothetical protein H6732_15175 [Alphaproteobacteria bacterium]|nr:hypothetical protein [Alphaproteobacteria bacterium]